MKIKIGEVEIPLMDYATSGTAILGIRDSGKTVTAKGIAEQLIEQGIPIIVFDAVGKWRFLKTPGDGERGRGYKVVVAGGRAGDLPLHPHSVSEIVRASMRENIPLVIDLYDPKLSKADWRRVVQQSIRIIHYENEGVRHVFLEEAAEYVPQKVQDGETYAEVEKFIRMGGNASVGLTLINQRSQEVNKAVLDLCQNLVLGCQIGNRAIEAVEKWVDRLAPEIAHKVTASLPRLKAGQAWVWTKSNPDLPVLNQMPMCRSLHPDRRTPEQSVSSRKSVDTAAFVQALTSTLPKIVEEQKANDPAELKRTVADLKRKLAAVQQNAPPVQPIEVPVLDLESHNALEKIEMVCNRVVKDTQEVQESLRRIRDQVEALAAKHSVKQFRAPAPPRHQPSAPRSNHVRPVESNGTLPKAERAILSVLANYREGKNRKGVAVIAGYAHGGGGFANALGALRTKGLIEGSDPLQITDAGLVAAGPVQPLPAGQELFQYWTNHPDLGRAEREILRVLYEASSPLAKEQIAPLTCSDRGGPYEAAGGGFNNAIGRLRTYELIEGRQQLQLTAEFYE